MLINWKRIIASTIIRRLTILALTAILGLISKYTFADGSPFPAPVHSSNSYEFVCVIKSNWTYPQGSTVCNDGNFSSNNSVTRGAPCAGTWSKQQPSYYVGNGQKCGNVCPANSTITSNSSGFCQANTGYKPLCVNGTNCQVVSSSYQCPDGTIYSSGDQACVPAPQYPDNSPYPTKESCNAAGYLWSDLTQQCRTQYKFDPKSNDDCNAAGYVRYIGSTMGCKVTPEIGKVPESIIIAPPIETTAKRIPSKKKSPESCDETAAPAGCHRAPNCVLVNDLTGAACYGDNVPEPQDDFCGYLYDGNGHLYPNPNDPDCAGQPASIATGSGTGKIVWDNGDGTTTSIETGNDVPTTVTSETANPASGTTTEKTTTLQPVNSPGGPAVTGTKNEQYNGIGSGKSPTPATPVNNIGSGSNSGTGSNGNGQGGSGNCEHCATEATLQEVRDALTEKTDHNGPNFDNLPDANDIIHNLGSDKTTALEGLSLPESATCPVMELEIEYLGVNLTFDHHCSIIAGKETMIRNLSSIGWLILAIVVIMGA